jgi:hypothetical protein
LTERKNDENEIDERKKNIVIFNAPESHADTAEKRKIEDISYVTGMYNSICNDNLLSESVSNARRLGKRPDNGSNRPLLITIDCESTIRKFFSKLYKLKDNGLYSDISVSHDMTREERQNTKVLVEQARKQTKEFAKNDEQASKNWAFKVRGPPWNQRIEKVRIRPQL